MSPTTKRICRILVTLRPDKVYIITLDHYVENLVPHKLMGYLMPFEDACNYAKNTLVL